MEPVNSSGVTTADAISFTDVSETWGGQITNKALIALAVFLVLVSIYIGIRYERDMAIAGIADIGMLFVRCRGGISHNPAEHVETADADIGARVLLRVIENFKPKG